MIPGSLGEGCLDAQPAPGRLRDKLTRFHCFIRRYFWLWIAYQTVKGLATFTMIWLPLWWAYQG